MVAAQIVNCPPKHGQLRNFVSAPMAAKTTTLPVNTSLELLSDYFRQDYFPLTKAEQDALSQRFTERLVNRRSLLLQMGEVCPHVYFVVTGCFRLYAVDQGGKEHNLLFATENEWMADLTSFYAQQPAGVYIEALESSRVLQIKHADLLGLFVRFHKFDRNFRILIERKYIELQNRVLQSISLTTQERYQAFMAQYPHLTQRLPNTQIASYLGITPEFLSKIRKDWVS